jgi:hypothetical protein
MHTRNTLLLWVVVMGLLCGVVHPLLASRDQLAVSLLTVPDAGSAPSRPSSRLGRLPNLTRLVQGCEHPGHSRSPELQFVSDKKGASISAQLDSVFKAEGRRGEVGWLYGFEKDYSGTASRFYRNSPESSPSSNDLDAVVNAYKAQSGNKDTYGKIALLVDLVHAQYEDRNKTQWAKDETHEFVCRHHAILLYEAAEKLDLTVNVRAQRGISGTHVYNYLELDGRKFMVDAYNSIIAEFK